MTSWPRMNPADISPSSSGYFSLLRPLTEGKLTADENGGFQVQDLYAAYHDRGAMGEAMQGRSQAWRQGWPESLRRRDPEDSRDQGLQREELLEALGGTLDDPQLEGDEHAVFFSPSGRVIKLTKPAAFNRGIPAYLFNLARLDAEYDLGIRVQAIFVNAQDNVTAIATSHQAVLGEPPTTAEVAAHFAALDYVQVSDNSYWNTNREELISDAAPKNLLKEPDGTIAGIDLHYVPVTGSKVDFYDNIARQRGTPR